MSNTYQMHGIVSDVKAPWVGRTGKPRRDLVIEQEIPGDPPRRQFVRFGFSGELVGLLDNLQILDRVVVTFGISCRPVVGRDSIPRHYVHLYGLDVRPES